MSCNGHNHRIDCDCKFRGGNKGNLPASFVPMAPLLGALAPPMSARPFQANSPRPCPRCGIQTYFVKAPNGGSFRAAADGSMMRHNCQKQVPYGPLSLRRPSSRKGWFSATVSALKMRGPGSGQALMITSLVEGGPFRVRLQDGLQVDVGLPAMCRWAPDEKGVLEIAYPDSNTGELTGTCVRARRLRG